MSVNSGPRDRAGKAQKTHSGTSDSLGLSKPKKQYGKSQEEVDKIAEDNKAIAKAREDVKLTLKKAQNQQQKKMVEQNRKSAAQNSWFFKW